MAYQQQSAFLVPPPYRVTESQNRHVLKKIAGNAREQEELFYVEGPAAQLKSPQMVATELWSDTPTLRHNLLARLKLLHETPVDKRGPDVRWPADTAFTEARLFVFTLPDSALSTLHMEMVADGEINFSWDTEQVDIDLGFYGTRPCSYYAQDKRRQRDLVGEAFDPAEGLPEPLRAFFSS